MKATLIIVLLSLSISSSCQNPKRNNSTLSNTKKTNIIFQEGQTIQERFSPPKGYSRIKTNTNSFAHYLQTLPLKQYDSPVLFYDGKKKPQRGVYISVVNMEIDNRDLQQCADAVMRLKGEYLFQQKKYEAIHFNFISDGKPRYYTEYANGDYSYVKFRKYMRYIFSYANTASLYHEMVSVEDIYEMQIGDVFIQKGNPYGHAVIVVDMAINKENGKKVYMLAQSYMPAQETQILINPMNSKISPWYELNEKTINTPEWIFYPKDLRQFKD